MLQRHVELKREKVNSFNRKSNTELKFEQQLSYRVSGAAKNKGDKARQLWYWQAMCSTC